MTTFSEFIENPASVGVHLLEVRPRERVTGWTATAGRVNVWQAAWANLYGPTGQGYRNIHAVREDGVLLTEVADVAAVEATGLTWYWDEAAGILYVQGAGGSPDNDDSQLVVEMVLRFATSPKIFDGYLYDARIDPTAIPAARVAGIDFLGSIQPSAQQGALTLANSDRLFDAAAYDWRWGGCRARMLFGGADLELAAYYPVFVGGVESIELTDTRLTITLRPLAAELATRIPVESYSEELDEGLDQVFYGRPRPILIGRKTIAPPKIRSKEPKWICRARSGAYARITDAAQTGLDITGDVCLYFKGTLPLNGDATWRSLAGKYKAANHSYDAQAQGSTGSLRLVVSGDGTNDYILTATAVLRAGSEQEKLLTYHPDATASLRAGHIWVDGEKCALTTSGTAPSAIYNGTGDFVLFAQDGGANALDYDLSEAIVAATYSPSGAKPTDPDAIKFHCRFTRACNDSSSNSNHLTHVKGSGSLEFVNIGGTSPVTRALHLDGTSEYAEHPDHADYDITGDLTLEVEFVWTAGGAARRIFGKFDEGSTLSFLIELRADRTVWVYISGDGSTAASVRTTGAIAVTSVVRLKAVYDASATEVSIWVNGVEFARANNVSQSGCTLNNAIPGAIYSGNSTLKVGAGYLSGAPGRHFNGRLLRAGIWAVESDDGTSLSHEHAECRGYWDFYDGNLNDFSGRGHALTGVGLEAGNYLRESGGDIYQIAGRGQSASINAVYAGAIEQTEDTDWSYDAELNQLAVWSEASGEISVDASGALVGDIPGGIAGRADGDLAERATDAILYLLAGVRGLEAEVIDYDSFSAARVGSKPVALWIDSHVSLSNVIQTLCVSDCLLDLSADEVISVRRYEPDITSGTALTSAEIEAATWSERREALAYRMQVRYGEELTHEELNPEVLSGQGIDTITTIETYLTREEDAALLASRLALLARRPPVHLDCTVPSLRLIAARPGDVILVTRSRGAGPEGALAAYPLVIREIDRQTGAGSVHLIAHDWHGTLARTAKLTATGADAYADADTMERISGGFIKTAVAAQQEGQLVY